MQRLLKYFSYFVIALYFALGVFVLIGPMFDYLTTEIKVIFSVFLFLYGAFRLVRLVTRKREEENN
jgi:uncharacterized membrane protein